jgi:hypothetical protein
MIWWTLSIMIIYCSIVRVVLYGLYMSVRMGTERPTAMVRGDRHGWSQALGFIPALVIALAVARTGVPQSRTCQRVELQGEVSAGQEWKTAFGQGWVFRVLPIAPQSAGYSGWDLAIDREQPAGYPDALLLATQP